MPRATDLFVDTSGWIAYVNQGDSQHSEAVQILQQASLSQRSLITTNYIIAELVALLTARLRLVRPQILTIIDLVKSLQLLEIIHVDTTLDDAAWTLLKARPDKDWSLVDAASFVVMTTYGISESLTTDHHFTQAGFMRLLTR